MHTPEGGTRTVELVPWHSDQPAAATEPDTVVALHAPPARLGDATLPIPQDRGPDVGDTSRCVLVGLRVSAPADRLPDPPRCRHQDCVRGHPPAGGDATPDLELPTAAPSTT
jgi:hypothetical protein